MRDLIPSGRFAQLTRLTRKALRVYAEHGLLRPVHTDPHSGYHYYSLSQLDEARRIGQLRAVGMSIALIQTTLRAWNTPGARAQLEQHRQQLLEQEEALRQARAEIDALLSAERPQYAVHTKPVRAQRCLAQRQTVPAAETCAFIDAAEPQLHAALADLLLTAAGALVVRYHESPDDDEWDIEVCLPFGGELLETPQAGIAVQELPGGTAAWTVHAGDCAGSYGLQVAYEALWSWVRDHGHDTLGPPYEVYLFDEGNTAEPADYRTEIGWLIAPAAGEL